MDPEFHAQSEGAIARPPYNISHHRNATHTSYTTHPHYHQIQESQLSSYSELSANVEFMLRGNGTTACNTLQDATALPSSLPCMSSHDDRDSTDRNEATKEGQATQKKIGNPADVKMHRKARRKPRCTGPTKRRRTACSRCRKRKFRCSPSPHSANGSCVYVVPAVVVNYL